MAHEEEEAKEVRVAYRSSDTVTEGRFEPETPPRGVQYLVDESGRRKAVVISLELCGDLWEDFCDVLVAELRKDEPTIAWETLKGEFLTEEPARASEQLWCHWPRR